MAQQNPESYNVTFPRNVLAPCTNLISSSCEAQNRSILLPAVGVNAVQHELLDGVSNLHKTIPQTCSDAFNSELSDGYRLDSTDYIDSSESQIKS